MRVKFLIGSYLILKYSFHSLGAHQTIKREQIGRSRSHFTEKVTGKHKSNSAQVSVIMRMLYFIIYMSFILRYFSSNIQLHSPQFRLFYFQEASITVTATIHSYSGR